MTYSAKPFSILQLSDLHVLPHSNDTLLGVATEHYFNQVLAHAFELYHAIDLILLSGDLAQDPCLASYRRIKQTLAIYPPPAVCLPGNHDDWPLMQQMLQSDKISCDKQLLFGHWQLINLNSQKLTDPGGLLLPDELDFLSHCLQTHPNRHALIAVHHHCTPSGSAWLDTMQISNSSDFFNCLLPYPQVQMITTGHIHQELVAHKQGITILGSPSTCFQFKPFCKDFTLDNSAPGYRLLELYPNAEIKTQVHRLPIALDGLHSYSDGY